MRNKRTALTLLAATLILVASAATAHAIEWTSDFLYQLDNGATIGLTTDVTAEYDSAANDGATVTFTNLNVASGGTFSSIAVTYDAANNSALRITKLNQYSTFEFTNNDTASTITIAGIPRPAKVYFDNVQWLNGWSYNDQTDTATITSGAADTKIEFYTSQAEEEYGDTVNQIFNMSYTSITLIGVFALVSIASAVLLVFKSHDGGAITGAAIVTLTVGIAGTVAVIVLNSVQVIA